MIARLDREMKEVEMCVAVTVADRNRFEAAAGKNGPDDFWARRLRAPDAETMARVLAAQKSAVEDLKEQLRDVNDRVEGVKRHARIEAANAPAAEVASASTVDGRATRRARPSCAPWPAPPRAPRRPASRAPSPRHAACEEARGSRRAHAATKELPCHFRKLVFRFSPR